MTSWCGRRPSQTGLRRAQEPVTRTIRAEYRLQTSQKRPTARRSRDPPLGTAGELAPGALDQDRQA